MISAILQQAKNKLDKNTIYSIFIGYTLFNLIFYNTILYCFIHLNISTKLIFDKLYISSIPIIIFILYEIQVILLKNKKYVYFKILNNIYMFCSFFISGFLSAYILNNISLNKNLFFERFMLFYLVLFFIINYIVNFNYSKKSSKSFLKENQYV